MLDDTVLLALRCYNASIHVASSRFFSADFYVFTAPWKQIPKNRKYRVDIKLHITRMDFVDYWKENYRTDVIYVGKTNGMIS